MIGRAPDGTPLAISTGMRMGSALALTVAAAFVAAGCGKMSAGDSPFDAGVTNATDLAMPPNMSSDMAAPGQRDAAMPMSDLSMAGDAGAGDAGATDLAQAGDGGVFMPPGSTDDPIDHAPPSPIAVTTLLSGQNVLDVSVDQGGGVWAVTSSTVYYFAPGHSSPYTYNQANGLARGEYQWTDTWFEPGTYPVTFQSVSGAQPGEAIVGNIGAIADRLEVDPSTGAVTRLDNMQVTPANTNASEYPEHLKRVVAVWHSVVDLNGTFAGTAYMGGFHGFYAFHGLDADCGCLAFEEHQHYITDSMIAGDDVKGLALSLAGDIWTGDRDFVTLLPQRSQGPSTGLFSTNFTVALDVFPGVRDEVQALATDGSDGVWVASYGNGAAYIHPMTHAIDFFSSNDVLPQNHLRAVAVDGQGDVWIGAAQGGIARLHPSTGVWTYYRQSTGLPSNDVNAVYWDKLSAAPHVYIATDNGIAIY